MPLTLTIATGPVIEPVSVSDAREQARVDVGDDDVLIAGYITAARRQAELILGRALVSQTLELRLDDWPDGDTIELPRPPLSSVTSVKYYDEDDTEYTLSSDNYRVDTWSEPGLIRLKTGQTWPTSIDLRSINGIVVTYVAGYGSPETVPAEYRQAILMAVAHWYENRELSIASGAVPKELPWSTMALLRSTRVHRF